MPSVLGCKQKNAFFRKYAQKNATMPSMSRIGTKCYLPFPLQSAVLRPVGKTITPYPQNIWLTWFISFDVLVNQCFLQHADQITFQSQSTGNHKFKFFIRNTARLGTRELFCQNSYWLKIVDYFCKKSLTLGRLDVFTVNCDLSTVKYLNCHKCTWHLVKQLFSAKYVLWKEKESKKR